MEFTKLFEDGDDRAVSPVIGVILMVAITVILAAVIGTFVLGLGDQVQTTAPNAQFTFNYDAGVGTEGELTVTHDGGDGIDANELYIRGDVNNPTDSWADKNVGVSTVKSGTNIIVGDDGTEDYTWSGDADTVRVVWESSDSDQSSTLRTWSKN